MQLRSWACHTLLVLVLVACGDDDGSTDAGLDTSADVTVMDSSDVCADGRLLCATVGTSCSGDDVLTCALDADGCMVQTTTDCTATSQTCESGACVDVVDPCEGVPVAEQCDTEGRTCDVDTLVDCAPNASGCLVLTETDCTTMPGGACNPSDPAMCVVPPDPCDGVSDCDTEAASCDVDNLITCAPDAFGCLVETTDNCASRIGGSCDATTSACVFTGDPCAGIAQCATEAVACAGPELVRCAPDAFGCLVETRTDCTDTMFGFCDVDADPNACSTLAVDPCEGLIACDPVGRACDTDDLIVCAVDAFGCAVETTTDCTADGDICGERDGMAICDEICSFRDVCRSASYCDADDAITCADDADGCLVETDRTTCGGATTCDSGTCSECPGAVATVLDCASGTVSGDTSAGTMAIDSYSCTTFNYPNREQVHTFLVPDAQEVTVVATRGAGTGDYDLYALRANGTTCTDSPDCADRSVGTTGVETVTFAAAPGELYYLAYDLFGTTAETTDYTLTITCTTIVCGDSTLNGDETCDDGGAVPGDGCSDTCAVEAGYECVGTGPGSCTFTCGNSLLDGADECDDGGIVAGDGCSDTCAIEPGYVCTGTGPGSCTLSCGNGALEGADECDDGDVDDADGCSSVCVIEDDFWCVGLPSACAAPVCGDASVDGGEDCEDGNTTDGDGCSARCASETAASGSAIALAGTIADTDLTYSRQGGGCGADLGNDTYYDTFVVENTTAVDQTLTITATWAGGDGFLFVYDYSFYDANPVLNCVDGDDDFMGLGQSQLTGVSIAAGQRLVIVATAFVDLTAIGDYTIDVTTD